MNDAGRPAWVGMVARGAFPVALLLFAGFFFAGRLGWWSDDHWHNLRDTATDQVSRLVLNRGVLLRPLFYVVVPPITTLWWHHDWAAHAVQLAWHALVVVMLWRLMRMMGIGRRAAGAAALLFMVYPAQFEALFWVSAMPTTMAAAVMLGVMMLAVRFARGQAGWWAVVAMGVLTFAACCLNEQPASVAAALPVLAWAVGGTQREEGEERGTRSGGWIRTLAPGAMCGVMCVVYIAMLRASLKGSPPGVRGSAESFVSPDRVWERTVYFLDVLWRRLVMKNWGSGALKEGWERVGESGAWWAVGGVAALGVVWAWAGRRAEAGQNVKVGRDAIRGWRLAALGLAVFAVGWLPIWVMAKYEPDSRCRYWPNVGLAIVVGVVVDRIARRLMSGGDAQRGVVVAARLGLVAVLTVCGVMLVGVQAGFRNRWAMDLADGESLRRQVPDPAPYSMVIPLEIEARGLRTGSPVLDTHFRSVWEFPWTVRVFVERVYRRQDVRAGYWRHWTGGVPVRGGDMAGLHYADPNFGGPRFESLGDGVSLVPWERAVLFTVGADGGLRVATAVRLVRAGAEDVVVRLPQAAGLAEWEVRMPRIGE